MEQKYVMAAIDAALKAGEKILSIYNDPEIGRASCRERV